MNYVVFVSFCSFLFFSRYRKRAENESKIADFTFLVTAFLSLKLGFVGLLNKVGCTKYKVKNMNSSLSMNFKRSVTIQGGRTEWRLPVPNNSVGEEDSLPNDCLGSN